MSENFDMILNRDKNLQKISKLSSDLKENSGKVRKGSIFSLQDIISLESLRIQQLMLSMLKLINLDYFYKNICSFL